MGTGRKRIPMKKIENINHRRVTFTKRRQGLCRKAAELSLLTGCKIAILTFSCANTPFFYGDERDLLLERAAADAFGNPNCGKFNTLSSPGASCSTYAGEEAEAEAEAGLENFSGCGDGGDILFLEAAASGSFGNLDCGKLDTLSGANGLEVASCSASPSEEAGLENFSGCGDGGDILLLEAAAAGSFGTLDCGKLNTLSGTGLEVASCSASPSEEAGLENFSEVADDKDLCLTEDDLEQLFADIEVDMDVAADNASCDMDASPMPSTTGDSAFQTVPCSSSAMSESYFFDDLCFADHTFEYYYEDMETVLLGSSSNASQSTSCLKESYESLGTCDFTDDGCSPVEENLDLQLLTKQSMEMAAVRGRHERSV